VLALHNITLKIGAKPDAPALLRDVSLRLPPGHFAGIVGPAGSGKSTLVKVIAGVHVPTEGTVHWRGRDLAEQDLAPADIGYVPQFSIAYEHLTIRENLDDAMRLRVSGLSAGQRRSRGDSILREIGLLEIADRRVRVLSGGEKRRLGLAMEIVSYPALLMADEVTSGLDPKAEEEMVRLMRELSRTRGRIVISVTHNLRHLALCDSVVVMHQGSMVCHAALPAMLEYFQVNSPEEVFPRLAERPAADWRAAWQEEGRLYALDAASPAAAEAESEPIEESGPAAETPGALAQFRVLVERRARIFVRDRSQMWLHLALLFGFPCLVVIFALEGLPAIRNLSMTPDVGVVQQLREANEFIIQSTQVGRLVSGLVMVQVVLLTLMGSNNSAREVAAERLIFEKEKLSGLAPASYLASKACLLFVLVAAQSLWMAAFVSQVCKFPGDFLAQALLLFLANAAMTSVGLAISSLMKSPEQASLVSVYLVGFQLPLSGAVLGLPEVFRWVTRPFIAAYWSWSGVLQTMRETRFYDVVQLVTPTDLAAIPLCVWALGCHVAVGLLVAYLGCKHSRWE
jgi:ABC-type multidrug transport system ATPase subunit